MDRTTIILPEPLKLRLKQTAEKQGVSFGKLVRLALEKFVFSQSNPLSSDPFLASKTIFADKGPSDAAKNHDKYLYRRNPHGKQTP